MSLDRRIVSILYFNGITEVELIQEFIGEKNNYYEVLIDNEVRKLKIPGYYYVEERMEELKDVVFTSFEYQEEIKKDEIKEVFEQKTFEELEAKKSSEESDFKVTTEIYDVPTVSIEDIKEEFKEEIKIEEVIKEKPKKPKATKKLKIIESKNDDEDFVNTI